MPIYEYACQRCQQEFETLVRNGEPVVCPQCGTDQLEKLLSAPFAHAAQGVLPIASPGGCGKPACQTGCQFDR